MSSVFAWMPCRGSQIDSGKQEQVYSALRTMAVRLPTDRVEEHIADNLIGFVVHHGVLRSGGIAVDQESATAVLICGSAWFVDRPSRLVSPGDVLGEMRRHHDGDRLALDGNYGLVTVDLERGEFVAQTDTFGIYPMYYALGPHGVAVSSEIKHLLGFVDRSLDHEAVSEMLSFGYIVTDRTLVQGIRRLPAGSRLIVRGSGTVVERFPRSVFARNRPVTNELLDELSEAFEASLVRYSADVPGVVSSLSGGLDSRIACLASRRVGIPVIAWSAGEPGSLESRIAVNFCRTIGIPIQVHQTLGERLADWFNDAIWVTEARCPPGHLHFLDGMMVGDYPAGTQIHGLVGDAVVGGDFDLASGRIGTNEEARDVSRRFMSSFIYWPDGRFQGAVASDLRALCQETRDRAFAYLWQGCSGEDPYSDFLWFRYQFRAFGFTVPCLCSQALPWTDLVVPYLDPKFFALCASIEHRRVIERQCQLRWAARRYPDFDCVPRVKDGIVVSLRNPDPANYAKGRARLQRTNQARYIICRLSQGRLNLAHRETYPFYGQWYRRWVSVRNYVDSTLLSRQCLDRGLWTESGVRRLLKDLRNGKNVWDAVGTMLMIEVFARQFVDGSDRPLSSLTPPSPLNRSRITGGSVL